MAYSEELWKILRTLYESGQYSSVPELRENCKKIWDKVKVPSQSAIEKRVADEGWNKHQLEPVIEEQIENATVKMFSELGMTRADAARRIIDGITLPDAGAQKIVNQIQAAIEQGESPMDERVFVAIKNLVADYGVAHKYLTTYCDVTGWEQPKAVKVDHTSKGKKLAAVDPTTVEDIETRVMGRIKKLQAAGVLKL